MTRDDARKQLQALGLVLKRTPDGEWRVNFKGGDEETAYYATDLTDALDTGRMMAAAAGGR
jgi:hypothetical protein